MQRKIIYLVNPISGTKNKKAALKIIEGATHTFNTKHPFEKSSDELENLIKATLEWIQTISCRD